jgi:hypothetical protein
MTKKGPQGMFWEQEDWELHAEVSTRSLDYL